MKKVIVAALVASVAVMSSCSGPQSAGSMTEGNKSKMDSLSYALGANVGYSMTQQMSDIPFDFTAIAEGITDAAFDRNEVSSEEALTILQSYFMSTRAERKKIVEANRAEADSLAIANGADEASVKAARAALKADSDMFESEDQRREVSYAFGIDLGTNIASAELPIQTYWLNTAMADVNKGNAKMDESASMSFLQNYFTVVRPMERLAASVANLAKVEKMKGVVKTPSGLLYRIEEAGDTSLMPTDDRDVVKVFYTGRLLRNDNVFDSNRFADRPEEQQEAILAQNNGEKVEDEPIEFPLNRVIKGWTEGMKLVGKGGRISLWIPSDLAYGESGSGRSIEGNEALFFDVELVDVTPYTEEEIAE
ncbi:MAG: FKBP-type peptidyl-prolyl cis-trans isomerase N-terminal domain-containing protein [Rikenellaceae bacterium]